MLKAYRAPARGNKNSEAGGAVAPTAADQRHLHRVIHTEATYRRVAEHERAVGRRECAELREAAPTDGGTGESVGRKRDREDPARARLRLVTREAVCDRHRAELRTARTRVGRGPPPMVESFV